MLTDRKRSCGKVMFSQVSVCARGIGYPWYQVISRGRVSLVPSLFQGVGYPWSHVLSRG